MSFKTKFSNLGHPNRIWAVAAVNGAAGKLAAIHGAIFDKFLPGDRIVYTGNYLGGSGAQTLETIDEVLSFRKALLACPGVMANDFVYLRGIQEELWNKLLQLQFAPGAGSVVEWIVKHHPEMEAPLAAYGSSLDEAGRVAREGVLTMTKWSGFLRNRIRQHPGHEKFFTILRRAAFTEHRHGNDNNLLFVHAGLDPELPLASQGDQFWWASKGFNRMEAPYKPFRAVIRGHDPEGQGVHVGQASISIDGGCGQGGQLVCARFSETGAGLELIAA